ncbi:MAG: hypothetical protein IMF19_17070 [Proteobacteria bacterium]|nr:hypothetical protein [Pseudomonadota bacterium]
MVKTESGKEGKKEGRITVDISGEILKQAIALRHAREDKEGVVIGISEVVRDAVSAMYKREIGKEAVEQ